MKILLDDNNYHKVKDIRFFSKVYLNTHRTEWYDEYIVEVDDYRPSILTLPTIKKEVILEDNEELKIR